jgi:hypothetical protein
MKILAGSGGIEIRRGHSRAQERKTAMPFTQKPGFEQNLRMQGQYDDRDIDVGIPLTE